MNVGTVEVDLIPYKQLLCAPCPNCDHSIDEHWNFETEKDETKNTQTDFYQCGDCDCVIHESGEFQYDGGDC